MLSDSATDEMQRLVGMNRLDLEDFEDEAPPRKDAAILINFSEWDEDKKQVSLSSEAVRVLTGTPINKDQEIKLSGTKVLELLQETASTTTMPPPPPSDGAEDANEGSSIGFSDENNDGEGGDEIAALAAGAMENAAAALQRRGDFSSGGDDLEGSDDEQRGGGGKDDDDDDDENDENADNSKELSPYTSNLQYLDDCFKVLKEQIKLSQIWEKEGMKSSGADQLPPWQGHIRAQGEQARAGGAHQDERSRIHRLGSRARPVSSYSSHSSSNRVGAASGRRKRCSSSSSSSSSSSKSSRWRRSVLSKRQRKEKEKKMRAPEDAEHPRDGDYSLSEFEHGIVILLIAHAVAPTVRMLYSGDGGRHGSRPDDLRVRQCLTIFCSSFREQVEKRPAFYKSAKLLQRGVVKVTAASWGSAELGECSVTLDRHTLETALGLRTEMSEVVEAPTSWPAGASMANVVLPQDQKQLVLIRCATSSSRPSASSS